MGLSVWPIERLAEMNQVMLGIVLQVFGCCLGLWRQDLVRTRLSKLGSLTTVTRSHWWRLSLVECRAQASKHACYARKSSAKQRTSRQLSNYPRLDDWLFGAGGFCLLDRETLIRPGAFNSVKADTPEIVVA